MITLKVLVKLKKKLSKGYNFSFRLFFFSFIPNYTNMIIGVGS